MKTKSKLSQREVWLLAILPAALVLIVSLGVPGPADDADDLERRLGLITSDAAQQRMSGQMSEASTEITASREQIAQLEDREAELRARLTEASAPVEASATKLDMADALDVLTRRLSEHGVQLLAMKPTTASSFATVGTASSTAGRRRLRQRPNSTRIANAGFSTSAGLGGPTNWQLSVAGTWPAVHAALSDADVFPSGLWLSSLAMEPSGPNTELHRWSLFVREAEQK